ncbi:MAG: hypothetical protein VB017_02435 [Endomicrobiaceae bacterium]|nr:hypothetical protein [Endomicrobiaceae bacterium]
MFRSNLISLAVLFFLTVFSYSDFPVGIYGVENTADVAVIKKAGFNSIQTYKQDPEFINNLAAEAKKFDVKLLAYPYKIIDSTYKKDAGNYPVSAWYLYDEPDVWGVSREKLKALDVKVKESFPGQRTVFVIGQGVTKVPYYDTADILMVDWYPVPHLPLESFGQNISYARQNLDKEDRKNTPLWGVVQLFDWKEYKQYRSDDKRIGRFPYKDEIRFMSYDAVFNGASGLFYFTYTSCGVPLPESRPDDWKNISDVIHEISFVSKIFDKGLRIKNPGEVKMPLKAMSFEYEGKKYVFVINPTSEYLEIPGFLFNKNFNMIYGSSLDVNDIVFKPYNVFVFRYDK